MGAVWDADLPQNEKLILLAYADYAAHDGTGIYPSVGRMAWKTGYCERTVQRVTKELISHGILKSTGTHGKFGTNTYTLDVSALPQRPAYGQEKGGDKMSGGDTVSPGGRQNVTLGGDKMSPEPSCKPSVEPSSKKIGASAPSFFPEQFETSIADIKDLTFTMAQYQQMLQAEQDRGDDARVTLVDYLKRKTGGSLHPAIQIFREEMEHYPRKNQFDDIIERVGANGRLEFWRDVVNAWKLAGYNPYNVLGMLDCVERGELPNPQTTGGFNAKSRRTNGAGQGQRGAVYEPTAEEVEQARADARRKLAELRRERAACQTA
jgi:hypothetical protein